MTATTLNQTLVLLALAELGRASTWFDVARDIEVRAGLRVLDGCRTRAALDELAAAGDVRRRQLGVGHYVYELAA